MQQFDFTPLFRSTIGFDRLRDMFDATLQNDQPAYPPYNIERLADDKYRLTMAVAGFGEDDIAITAQENLLLVTGKVKNGDDKREYLYRGIAGRAFERRFQLADHIKVEGARLENGLLHIDLVREIPEAMKPRQIKVAGASQPQQTIDHAA
ncbi:MAG TPA: Hsp20 family protein [Dongiaceae bacterium]|nr:Hsp20 family protein [Dongiaceae bacterium]